MNRSENDEHEALIRQITGSTEDDRRRALRWGRTEYLILTTTLICLIGVGYAIFCFVWPWTPYTFRSVGTVPTTVCVGQQVTLTVDRTLKPANYDPKGYEYESYWINEETKKKVVTNTGSLSIPESAYGNQRAESPDYRTVTDTPGRYTFGQDIKLSGDMGPDSDKEQYVTMTAEDVTTVLPADDPRCPEIAQSTERIYGGGT